MSSQKPSRRKNRDSLVGPILLIGAGIIFLFNNMGWLEWSIWESLLRLWPLLLIIGGLDLIIGRRSALGGAVVGILAVVMLVGGVWFMNGDAGRPAAIVDGTSVSFPLDGAQQAVVKIGLSTGELRLADGADSLNVMDGEVQNPRGEQIRQSNEKEASTVYATLEAQGKVSTIFPGSTRNNIWDLRLNQEIPIDLTVSTGVGESTLDLRRLTLTGLDLNAGIGTTTVTLPRQGTVSGEISGGIGRTVIRVPADLAVRLTISTGIGGKSVPGSFRQEGDAYLSPAFVEAGEGGTLKVSGGIGQIQVDLIPAE